MCVNLPPSKCSKTASRGSGNTPWRSSLSAWAGRPSRGGGRAPHIRSGPNLISVSVATGVRAGVRENVTPGPATGEAAAGSLVRFLGLRKVPQAHRVVVTPRGQQLTVRAEGHGSDARRVACQGTPGRASGHVPQPHCLVPAPRGQQL